MVTPEGMKWGQGEGYIRSNTSGLPLSHPTPYGDGAIEV